MSNELKDIPEVRLNGDEPAHGDLEDKKATETGKRPSDYVEDPSFLQRIGRTWRGQNEAGRVIGTILDVVETFLPGYAGKARSIIQQTTNTMDKPFYKSKSVWGAILLALTAILQAFGVDAVGDPMVMENVYHVLYGLAGFLGITGLRHAVGRQIKQGETQ